MLDISDGLVADARHLAAASGVRLTIDGARLPCGEGIEPLAVLSSGEEYELLAALPPEVAGRLLEEWPSRFAVPLTAIGTVTAVEPGGAIDIGGLGSAALSDVSFPSRVEFGTGHDHFSR